MPKSNQVSFGTKSLHIQRPMVWNALPFHIKSKENFQTFKYVISFGWDRSKVAAIFVLTLKDPLISESCIAIKIQLNFYFHTFLWCLERFYEGF